MSSSSAPEAPQPFFYKRSRSQVVPVAHDETETVSSTADASASSAYASASDDDNDDDDAEWIPPIDFDEASRCWRANKRHLGNGVFEYVSTDVPKKKRPKRQRRTPIRFGDFVQMDDDDEEEDM